MLNNECEASWANYLCFIGGLLFLHTVKQDRFAISYAQACADLYRPILLANSPHCALNRLQRVMNAAARLVCRAGRRAHVSELLRDRLHWLRVPQRVDYKLCLLAYKALHGAAPGYLSELCRPIAEEPEYARTRAAERGDLRVPRTATDFGTRAFAVAGPKTWNSLPEEIRSLDSLTMFKAKLKTHLFI